MNQYNSKNIQYLTEEIKKGTWAILLIAVIFFALGVLNLIIEDSNGKPELITGLLFFTPTMLFLISAIATKKGKLNAAFYSFLSIAYFGFTLLEFQLNYTLDSYIKNFSISGTGSTHPMSIIIEVVPLVYKAFRIVLVIIFIRLTYFELKLKKAKKAINTK